MKTILGITGLAILTMVLGLMFYLGAFKPVSVKSVNMGPYRIVYKPHLGAYHKIVPAIEVVERWAVANNEACLISFGEYIDDPNVVDEDRLHSNGGCVVDANWAGRLPSELQYREIPRRLFVIAEFAGAPSIGPQKVYPKAYEFIAAQKLKIDGPVIEMYERRPHLALRTRYHFPVKN